MEASSWDTAEALRDKDFVPCKSYSSSHRPSPGKRDEEKSQINAFYETVVAAWGRDVPEPAAVVLVAMKVTRLALAVQDCGGAFDAGRAVGASTAACGWRRMGAAM